MCAEPFAAASPTLAAGTESRQRDRCLLLAASFLRAVGTSLVAVLLGVHLAQIRFSPQAIGYVSGAGLAGVALGALGATLWSERWGRRHSLVAASLVAACGAAGVALASTPAVVTLAAFVGMVNAMGRDRGPALVIEQAALPAAVPARRRTLAFAWYNALQDSGHALGSLLAGAPSLLARAGGIETTLANRWGLALLPALTLVTTGLYLALSPAVEETAPGERRRAPPLSPATRRTLFRLSSLFALDGFGGGLLITSLLSYFFFERFGVSVAEIAGLFALARLANVASHFAAAGLARRIGLVNTMVFTHLPSSLLLVAVACAPSFGWAAALFLLRESLVKMDVPTRQSYVMGVVEPAARTAAAGVTNLVRLPVWAAGPPLAGLLMHRVGLAAPLLLGAAIKTIYDLLLYRCFRRLRPPEEEDGLRGSADDRRQR